MDFPGGSDVKEPACNTGDPGSIPGSDPLEKEMATHSSILAWKIQWMEEPGRLQSMGLQSRTRLSDFTFFLSFLSLVAQMVKKPPAMWKIWV